MPIILLFNIYLNGQTSEVETNTKNSFFKYKSRIYTPIWSEDNNCIGVLIDTLNVCRIKQSKIKSLKIYYFTSISDSSLWISYNYDKNGFISNMNPIVGWYGYTKKHVNENNIICDEYKHEEMKKKRRKYHLLDRYKETFEYNDMGYLTKYTHSKLGFINRWLTRTIGGGTVKYITYYDYNEDYTAVQISNCYKSRLISKKCKPLYFDTITCKFDENGNLLSEMKYKFNEKMKAILVEGFKYQYDYFK